MASSPCSRPCWENATALSHSARSYCSSASASKKGNTSASRISAPGMSPDSARRTISTSAGSSFLSILPSRLASQRVSIWSNSGNWTRSSGSPPGQHAATNRRPSPTAGVLEAAESRLTHHCSAPSASRNAVTPTELCRTTSAVPCVVPNHGRGIARQVGQALVPPGNPSCAAVDGQ